MPDADHLPPCGRAASAAPCPATTTRMDGPMTTTYVVTVSREEPWWVAVVASLPGSATEARRLDRLEVEGWDLIAGLTDADEDSFDLTWEYALQPEVEEPLHKFLAARARRQEAEDDYTAAQTAAVEALTMAHVSLRDAAELLGLSYQRVAQIRSRLSRTPEAGRASAAS